MIVSVHFALTDRGGFDIFKRSLKTNKMTGVRAAKHQKMLFLCRTLTRLLDWPFDFAQLGF